MRFAGIDVAAERPVVAVVDERGQVPGHSSPFGEDEAGYQRLFELLGGSEQCLLALEATGHYWRNLFLTLVARGYSVAMLNPLRTQRLAEEELERTKTDAIDALGIVRFAAQKRPGPAQLPDPVTEELRELVRLREGLLGDLGDRLRQLHRAVDLGFPEFTRHVRTLDSELAIAILSRYRTAVAFRTASQRKLARLCYDGRQQVGEALARVLVESAKGSVGQHHSGTHQLEIGYARISLSCAAVCGNWSVRSVEVLVLTWSANCSRRSLAFDRRPRPISSGNSAILLVSIARRHWPVMSVSRLDCGSLVSDAFPGQP
jgi:transposase